jgi:hypothetical protein
MELRSVTLVHKGLVNGFPGSADACCLSIWNGDGMNGIGVLMVEHKDVVVATTGRNREATGLVGVAFQNGLIAKEHYTELMSTGVKLGS